MYLTITGKLGSGKSTICSYLVDKHGFRRHSTGEVQRKIALEMGISTLELNELMNKDSKYDDLIDNETVKISKDCRGEDIIFDSRMAFYFVENAYDIFTTIDPNEAARRVMLSPRGNEETYTDMGDAKFQLLERSRLENIRFKDIYQIDNLDYNNYNLVIDTTWAEPEQLADIIYKVLSNDLNAEKKQIFISPKSLYPTEKLQNINMDKVNAIIKNKDMGSKVKVLYFDNYHYIINGHHNVIAALINKDDFISAESIKLDDFPSFKEPQNIVSELNHVGLSTLHDYEELGGFNYKSYPEFYKN